MKYHLLTGILAAILVIGLMLVSGCTVSKPTANTGDNTPLTFVAEGNGNYYHADHVILSGAGPKRHSLSITIIDSAGGVYRFTDVTVINDDGLWSYYYDLSSIPVAGKTTITATTTEERPESASVVINILS